MAKTLDQRIDELEALIDSGTRRNMFREGGTHREVEMQSMKDMRERLAELKLQRSGKSRVIRAALD